MIEIAMEREAWIDVGRLGRFFFPAGWYGYVGSAHGPGGLRARLARHQRTEKRLHWHVDYLLAHGTPRSAWWVVSSVRLECAWAAAVQRVTGGRIVAPGFGSSDCGCRTHLVYLDGEPPARAIENALALVSPGIQRC